MNNSWKWAWIRPAPITKLRKTTKIHVKTAHAISSRAAETATTLIQQSEVTAAEVAAAAEEEEEEEEASVV